LAEGLKRVGVALSDVVDESTPSAVA